MIAVISYIVADYQRRELEREAVLRGILQSNQTNWINLEKYFTQHAPQLNRLYKQMWTQAPDVQALPDAPLTSVSRMQEVHAANMIMGVIQNMNERITQGKPPDQVVTAWQAPQYRTWFNAISEWFQSDILCQRYLSSRHLYSRNLQTLVDSIAPNCHGTPG